MNKFLPLLLGLIILTLVGCVSPKVKMQKLSFSEPIIHYVGKVPGANTQTQYQLDLFENKTYFIRTISIKNGIAGKNYDELGRWKQDENNRVILTGSSQSPKYFYILNATTLEVMDLKGQRIDSKLSYKLEASQTVKTLEPRVLMNGMFSYMADATMFKELITGVKYPVAMEEDYISLEREYLKLKKVAGESLRTYLEGQIVLRDAMEGNRKIPTLVVKKFIKIDMKTVPAVTLGTRKEQKNL